MAGVVCLMQDRGLMPLSCMRTHKSTVFFGLQPMLVAAVSSCHLFVLICCSHIPVFVSQMAVAAVQALSLPL